jgi:nicotinate-nucleotide--dimethylbenzimidazole phosphoribosyltransferase
MAFGMEALAKQPDLLALGEVGVGGEVAAAAVACALYGGEPSEWSAHPALVAEAVTRARGEGVTDPVEILRQLGGREMAAQAGAILAARTQKTPVLLDSYGGCAAAAVLAAIRPDAADHCMAAQVCAQPGHAALLERLGFRPLLDLGLAGSSGLGASAAIGLVRLAAATYTPG